MKFKVGERVKIADARAMFRGAIGREAEIVALPGSDQDYPEAYEIEFIGARPSFLQQVGQIFAYEETLRKLLPDSDTYHPANISIDDLMRGLKERETA